MFMKLGLSKFSHDDFICIKNIFVLIQLVSNINKG